MQYVASHCQNGLIVDDDPGVRAFVATALSQQGFSVRSARSGAEALELIRQNPGRFNFVLTDYEMGAMNGIELAAAVRSLFPGIRLILMSGNEICADGVADGFLSKPFTVARLCETLNGALRLEDGPSVSAGDLARARPIGAQSIRVGA